jgi:ribosomal protein S18 acetylase RimI-like enzyme
MQPITAQGIAFHVEDRIYMHWIRRRVNGDEDYWRIRDFMRQVMLLRGKQDYSWHVARFDYWRWHGIENLQPHITLESVTFTWESLDGQIVALLNPEGEGEAFLHVRPEYHSRAQMEEMVMMAEDHLAIDEPSGQRKLRVWCNEHDLILREILIHRSYILAGEAEYQRWRTLDGQLVQAQTEPGYSVRSLGDIDEHPSRSWASWKAFHPDEPDERYEGWEWYLNIQRIPLYRRDLDLVGITQKGEIAGFCTVWFDDVTRSAYFEPVGVMPAHQRHGLGRALMYTGLQRLQRLGARKAFVGSYEPAAHALYASAGFTEYDRSEAWVKVF